MACPDSVSNTVMVNAPPDPVTTIVRIKFYRDSDLVLVIDMPPNAVHDFNFHFIGQGWIAKCRAKAGDEYSANEDTEEFDGCDPSDFPFTPTNANIPGPDIELGYDT